MTLLNLSSNSDYCWHIVSETGAIVIVSPNLKQSQWIDWEIEYSLKEITHEDKASRANGIICVIQKNGGSYEWLCSDNSYDDGCTSRIIDSSLLYKIINDNRFNLLDKQYSCSDCKTVDRLTGSYISVTGSSKRGIF